MNWKIRHAGSPKAVEDLTLEQIVEGLQDGLWETTDEVMGPGDSDWIAIENHPLLEEAAAEIEPPPPKREPDETRLDMTPLIDVCLVLLIFMILTISYGALQMQLQAAQVTADAKEGKLKTVSDQKVKETMIIVEAQADEKGEPIITIEGTPVAEADLERELRRLVGTTRKLELLIKPGPGVRRKTIVAIQDAAGGASIGKIHVLASKDLISTVAPPPPPMP